MKRQAKTAVILFVTLLLIVTGTTVFAQGWGNPRGQEVTVEGTLQLADGTIAIVGGEVTWFVPAMFRYVGFIDDLKEGAKVSIQGYTDGYDVLMPVTMTINGKSYDLSADTRRGGYGWGGYRGGGYGGGCGGWGGGRGRCW